MCDTKSDVLIIVPPFASVDFPMLGPSILTTSCKKEGINARVFYSNLLLASKIGYSLYERIAVSSFSIMAGEALFTQFSYPGETEPIESVIDAFFKAHTSIKVAGGQLKPISKSEIAFAQSHLAEFMNEAVNLILDSQAKIIGFSSVFQQNHSSIGMARMIKEIHSEKIIVLGGANASSPMGNSFRGWPFDYVFSGESDSEFPIFVRDYIQNKILPNKDLIECAPVKHMDDIPLPDFKDYFSQLAGLQAKGLFDEELPKKLPFESSRGCWWGAVKHCTFCGLNGKDMSYRNKSPKRILDEIEHLSLTYNVSEFQATDNIMPNTFRKDVLPALADQNKGLSFFYEVKSNLKTEELDLFVQAGITTIQPGIESFSTSILKKIDKGVSGIQNIWLLRECLSRKIQVIWNVLMAIPGDSRKDYDTILGLAPKIQHLNPPQGASRIVIDRYSPYHSFPTKFNIADVTPLPAYSLLYPAGYNLDEIAYHFTGVYDTIFNDPQYEKYFVDQLNKLWLEQWQNDDLKPPQLYMVDIGEGRVFIEDTRTCASEPRFSLDRNMASTLKLLDKPKRSLTNFDLNVIEELKERNLIISHEDRWMSVVATPEIGFNLRNSMRCKSKKGESKFYT